MAAFAHAAAESALAEQQLECAPAEAAEHAQQAQQELAQQFSDSLEGTVAAALVWAQNSRSALVVVPLRFSLPYPHSKRFSPQDGYVSCASGWQAVQACMPCPAWFLPQVSLVRAWLDSSLLLPLPRK